MICKGCVNTISVVVSWKVLELNDLKFMRLNPLFFHIYFKLFIRTDNVLKAYLHGFVNLVDLAQFDKENEWVDDSIPIFVNICDSTYVP